MDDYLLVGDLMKRLVASTIITIALIFLPEFNWSHPKLFSLNAVLLAYRASIFKSIQAANRTGDGTITLGTSVITANTLIRMLGVNGTLTVSAIGELTSRAVLTNSTTVTITGGGAGAQVTYILVEEYNPNTLTINGVQRGTISLSGATSNTATITATTGAHTTINNCGWTAVNASGQDIASYKLVRTNTTTVTVSRVGSRVDSTDIACYEVADFK